MIRNKNKVLAELTNDLLDMSTPIEWIDFVFMLQNAMIEKGHVNNLNELGVKEFSERFWMLNRFFTELRDIEADQKTIVNG